MKFKEFLNYVAGESNTKNQDIGADDVSRVFATAFDCLHSMGATEASNVIAQGLNLAEKRASKGAGK